MTDLSMRSEPDDDRLYARGRQWAPVSELEDALTQLSVAQDDIARLTAEAVGWEAVKDLAVEAAEKKAERWREGFLAEVKARADAEQTMMTVAAQLVDVEAERDQWHGRAEELSGIEDVAIQQTQRALAAEEERDAARTEAAFLAEQAQKWAADGLEAIHRADRADRDRDEWGGKAATASHQVHLFRHQRNEDVRVLGELLAAVEALIVHRFEGSAGVDPALAVALGKAEQLVTRYRRAAELRSPEQVAADVASEEGQPT